jgi:hypothetical protein
MVSRGRDRPGALARTDLICRVVAWATGIFVVASALAAAWPDTFLPLSVPLDLVLFAVGCAAFLWAYVLAIGRSRYEAVTMGGLFFLSDDVAPPDVTRLLRGALGVQVVVAVAVASVRPFTALAFSVLVPMLGLGLMALWAARHGRFPPKPPDEAE